MFRFLSTLVAVCVFAVVRTAHATPAVADYGKLPAIDLVRISPSGQDIAFIATDGSERSLYVRSVAGEPLVVMPLGDSKVRDIWWVGDDHVLVERSLTLNMSFEFGFLYELGRITSINVRTKKLAQIFPDGGSVWGPTFGYAGAAEIDGRRYAFVGGYPLTRDLDERQYFSGGTPNLYRVDLDSGQPFQIDAGNQATHSAWLVDPSGGSLIARQDYKEESGEWRLLAGFGHRGVDSGRSAFGEIGFLGRGRSPDTVLLEKSDQGGVRYEEHALVAGATPTPILDGRLVKDFLFDKTSALLIGATVEGDAPQTVLFSPALQARFDAANKAFAGYTVELIDYSADFGRLIVHTTGGDDSGTYWLVDLSTGKAKVLGADYPTVQAADTGRTQIIDYTAADGLALHGVLTLPPNRPAKALPLVVLPHGGPESRDYIRFDWWAQAFASQGYAVWQPNFRGSSGYGAEFRNAGFGQWGRKMQTDISDGVAELARRGIVDPARACIVGGSYGGYAALAGVTLQHGLYRCAVSVAGVADPADLLQHVTDHAGFASADMRYTKAFLGVGGAIDPALNAISPVKLAAQADAPILLIHGKDDSVVPFRESEEMNAALQKAEKPVEFVIMRDEDHWLSREATRTVMLKAAVAFVEKHDPPN